MESDYLGAWCFDADAMRPIAEELAKTDPNHVRGPMLERMLEMMATVELTMRPDHEAEMRMPMFGGQTKTLSWSSADGEVKLSPREAGLPELRLERRGEGLVMIGPDGPPIPMKRRS